MNLNFNKVHYDGDLSDFSEDELQEIVREFESAQESNVAEFETATEALEEVDESIIEDFEDARKALIEDITESEDFDSVPLTEAKLEGEDFSDLQDWKEFVAGQESVEDDDDNENETFDDFGKKSETNSGDEMENFVEEELGSMQGLNIQ